MSGRASQKAETIKLVALDVDGVMTDGSILYGSQEIAETKAFNVKDGLGIKLLQERGIEVAIITGRTSESLERRAVELGISLLLQGREDKGAALVEILTNLRIAASDVAYMGDDLPDLPALNLAGLAACPSDAVTTIIEAADWVAPHPGGQGAVRALCDFILKAQGYMPYVRSSQ